MNYQDHDKPHFFARPTAVSECPRIDGRLDFIELKDKRNWTSVLDHSNGLVLYFYRDCSSFYVCNPLTRCWKHIPRHAGTSDWKWKDHAFLLFNPTVSKHYKVLLAPRDPRMIYGEGRTSRFGEVDDAGRRMEWPPSRWTWHEFSSRTGRWRDRVFAREGTSQGTVADFLMDGLPYSMEPRWCFAVHWKGALYVHCHAEFVARQLCLFGALIFRKECTLLLLIRLRVWILNEQPDQTEWMLKHDKVLKPDDWWGIVLLGDDYHQMKYDGPWIVDEYEEKKTKNDVEWSSDDDDCDTSVSRGPGKYISHSLDMFSNSH
ncbi:hypothetical protein PR202_ga22679 [Eleusine coracana subsp. coracana]|uniref:Uncharacterized protein n=1 Tax=Eleusine coracana subsp. coracana TaxID=191504 RepID=A0AAV5D4K0_ELECO|nr:hypothetical protein PR202_ga22679 [Eleusine coracana subsp. coracana]